MNIAYAIVITKRVNVKRITPNNFPKKLTGNHTGFGTINIAIKAKIKEVKNIINEKPENIIDIKFTFFISNSINPP